MIKFEEIEILINRKILSGVFHYQDDKHNTHIITLHSLIDNLTLEQINKLINRLNIEKKDKEKAIETINQLQKEELRLPLNKELNANEINKMTTVKKMRNANHSETLCHNGKNCDCDCEFCQNTHWE
jgi:hypothetical protein